jgi:hypothetical protein
VPQKNIQRDDVGFQGFGVGEPPKSLRGFQRVTLNPGQTQHVTISLRAELPVLERRVDQRAVGEHRLGRSVLNGPSAHRAGQHRRRGGHAAADHKLAQGKPVTATGSVGGFPSGTRRRKHRQLLGKHEQRVPAVWFQVDLGAATRVGRMVLTLPSTVWARGRRPCPRSAPPPGRTSPRSSPPTGYRFDPATRNTATVTIPSTTQRYFRLAFTGNTGWAAAQLSELQPYGSSSSLTGRAGPGDVRSRVREDALHDPPGRAHGRGVAAELRRGELGD